MNRYIVRRQAGPASLGLLRSKAGPGGRGLNTAFAFSLRSDHPGARAVRSLWSHVARFEAQPSMASLDDPLHIAFAIYDDASVSEPEARSASNKARRDLGIVTRTFDALRSCETSPMVPWAAPQPDPALSGSHEARSGRSLYRSSSLPTRLSSRNLDASLHARYGACETINRKQPGRSRGAFGRT